MWFSADAPASRAPARRAVLPLLAGLIGSPTMAHAQDFAPGQVWTYRDAVPSTSRVIVGCIDAARGGGACVVSVCVTDAPIPTKHEPLQTIGHLPFEAQALRESVIGQVGEVAVPPEFAEGYGLWRKDYDNGEAGAFDVSVADALRFVGETVGN